VSARQSVLDADELLGGEAELLQDPAGRHEQAPSDADGPDLAAVDALEVWRRPIPSSRPARAGGSVGGSSDVPPIGMRVWRGSVSGVGSVSIGAA
jgi:hypothetical protein